MLLQKPGQRAFELAGTVSVNQASDTLVGEQRFIEEPFGARECLVDAAADHVEIGRAGRAATRFATESTAPRASARSAPISPVVGGRSARTVPGPAPDDAVFVFRSAITSSISRRA